QAIRGRGRHVRPLSGAHARGVQAPRGLGLGARAHLFRGGNAAHLRGRGGSSLRAGTNVRPANGEATMGDTDLAIDIGTFTTKHTIEPGAIQIVCKGEGDIAALPRLEQFVRALHDVATASKVGEVTLDVREVSFMNSSCFTKLIGWITRVREMASESRYRIRI